MHVVVWVLLVYCYPSIVLWLHCIVARRHQLQHSTYWFCKAKRKIGLETRHIHTRTRYAKKYIPEGSRTQAMACARESFLTPFSFSPQIVLDWKTYKISKFQFSSFSHFSEFFNVQSDLLCAKSHFI